MFHLTIIRPDGQEVEQAFSGQRTVVGRHEKCDLCLMDSMVSRNHCLLLQEGQRFVVKDLDSRNGTWINGLAGQASVDLERYGFVVTKISNSSRQNFQK